MVIFFEVAATLLRSHDRERACNADHAFSKTSGIQRAGRDHQLPRNYCRAELMRRVFAMDVLECDRCGGRMRIIAAIHAPEAIRKILDSLGLPARAPPMASALRARDMDEQR